jgi:hypothetical protein
MINVFYKFKYFNFARKHVFRMDRFLPGYKEVVSTQQSMAKSCVIIKIFKIIIRNN